MIKIPARQTAFSRRDAYAEVRRRLADTPDDPGLQRLMLYFAPKSTGKAKNAVDWVSRFVARAGYRPHLAHLYSDESGRLIGMNGHVAAWTTPDPVWPVGYYHTKTHDPVDETAEYPNIDKIMPNTPIDTITIESFDGYEAQEGAGTLYRQIGGHWYDSKYLKLIESAGGEITLYLTGGDLLHGRTRYGCFLLQRVAV